MLEAGGQIRCQESNYVPKEVNPYLNFTVEDNINFKIKKLQEEILRLEKSKDTLGPLLKMRPQDILEAMNY